MKFPALTEAEGKLEAKQKELADIFAEAKTGDEGTIDLSKVRAFNGDQKAAAEKIAALNDELTDLGTEADRLRAVMQAAEHAAAGGDPGEPGAPTPAPKAGFTQRLFASDAFKTKGATSVVEMDDAPARMQSTRHVLNTLFETDAGWGPESTRSGRVDLSPEEEPGVTDLVPMIQWSQELYKFMRETTFTNNATEKAEGTEYGEAALALTEAEEAIRKVTVWIPLTDEQLADVPGARAYVESRLRFMVEQKLDQRMMTGNPSATPPQIRGFHNTANINSQAKGSDPVPDAIHKAITKVRVSGQATASGVVFHPENWEEVRLLRTADGVYIWGSPSEAGPSRIWGLPVVQSAHETKGQALVGAFRQHSLLAVRKQIDVQVSNSHSDFFIKGKQAMRADLRAALVVIRPPAFTEVTGLTA